MSIELSELILGKAEVRMSTNYATNLGIDTQILTSSDSIGECENCVVQEKRRYKEKRKVDILQVVDKIIVMSQVIIDISTIKMNSKNFNIVFGGDGSSGDFFIGGTQNNYYRTELIFTYPDGVSQMIYIVPKCLIVDPSKINLIATTDPSRGEFSIESLYPNNNLWGESSGKIIFNT